MDLGIPHLLPDRLTTIVPAGVYTGPPASAQVAMLYVWRTAALSEARGCTVAFFRWDTVFQAVLKDPNKYAARFLEHGVAAVCEPDCSMWRDTPLEEQVQSVRLARSIGQRWQEAGLLVAPVLNWTGPESYEFAFCGVPPCPAVIVIECRTLQCSADWPYFLAGLQAAVQRLHPQSIAIYGAWERRHWLRTYLPAGPVYRLLPSWQTAHDQQRKQAQHHNQLELSFPTKGVSLWAAEAAAEVSAAALR